jgi:hypothetical protein
MRSHQKAELAVNANASRANAAALPSRSLKHPQSLANTSRESRNAQRGYG